MTNQIRNPNDAIIGRFLALIILSLASSAACWWAAGDSLGLFFGGLFVVTFLVPTAVLNWGNLRYAIGGLTAAVVPVVIFWLMPALKGIDPPGQWMQAIFVITAYVVAIAGFALVLARVGLPTIFAAAVSVVIGLSWLTWPIWLSTMLVNSGHSAIIQYLVAVHPPLTINGILTNEPAWTERSLAYHLTNLNQDVPIKLPDNARACVALHGIVGLMLWAVALIQWPKSAKPRHFENGINPA